MIPLPDMSDLGTCMCGHFDRGCDVCDETRRRMGAYNRAVYAALTPVERVKCFEQTIRASRKDLGL